jgi:hypothetical protein
MRLCRCPKCSRHWQTRVRLYDWTADSSGELVVQTISHGRLPDGYEDWAINS